MKLKRKKSIIAILFFSIIIGVTLSQAQPLKEPADQNYDARISHDEVVNQGLKHVYEENILKKINTNIFLDSLLLIKLEKWYNAHPMIEFASLIERTITIKFIDGSYTLLLDVFSLYHDCCMENERKFYDSPNTILSYTSDTVSGQTALILNPSDYLYGNLHCKRIINKLHDNGYNILYVENEAVDLTYVKYELEAEIVYMNTHAGYWDLDGDHQPDTVVIATGEHWTNETPYIHQFEYENKMIVKGMVGKKGFVAFTPSLIEYYYNAGDLQDSMIYMATCHAAYDDSMANAFLESGASAYIGWTQDTVFWTNSITSVLAFRLFVRGFTVNQVCKIIGYGGIYNFLFKSKLTYYGNGDHRIPT